MTQRRYHGVLTGKGDGYGDVTSWVNKVLADLPAGTITNQLDDRCALTRIAMAITMNGYPITAGEMNLFCGFEMDHVLPAQLVFDLWQREKRGDCDDEMSTLTEADVRVPADIDGLENRYQGGFGWKDHYLVWSGNRTIQDVRTRARHWTRQDDSHEASMAQGLYEQLGNLSEDDRNAKPTQGIGYHIVRIAEKEPENRTDYHVAHPAFMVETLFGLMCCQQGLAWPKYRSMNPQELAIPIYGEGFIRLHPGKSAHFARETGDLDQFGHVRMHILKL